MNNQLIVKENELEIIIAQDDDTIVSFNKETKELTASTQLKLRLKCLNDLKIEVVGDFDITTHGQLNINTDKEIAIDSNLPYETPSIFLNSKMAKQIKDLPESIKQRDDCAKKLKSILEDQDDCVHPHFSHEEEWFLKEWVQKMMKGDKDA